MAPRPLVRVVTGIGAASLLHAAAFAATPGPGAARLAAPISPPVAAAPVTISTSGTDAIEPLVQSVVDDSLLASVTHLVGYGTRQADMPQAAQAALWIAARFDAWGADSVFAHQWSSAYAPNVVAIRRGMARPRRVVLVGGHFDSISPADPANAPGADDNASGTACVLECARVLCQERFEATLHFAAFSAEEVGLVGSNAYAAHLLSTGDTLVAMLNVDMIGYRAPGDRANLDVIYNFTSDWLRQLAHQTTSQYVPSLPSIDSAYPGTANSDQQSFWSRGFSAISFYEDRDSSPFIHTPQDVVVTSFNDLDLATRSTQAAVALLATLARPLSTPIAVEELWARRTSAGNEIVWRLSDPAALRGVGVQRGVDARGPWVDATAAPLSPSPDMRFVDEAAVASDAVWYRLVLHTTTGTLAFAGPIAVDGPGLRALTSLLPPVDRGDVGVDVRWSLATSSRADITVFDVRGRRVRLLASGAQAAGSHLRTWDRRDDAGAHAARGVYFVHLRAGATTATRKVVVTRD